MFTRSRLTAAFLLLISAVVSDADAADSRLQHVSLLTARDRVSLVFELTQEPEDVSTRRVSAAVIELDAGPVVGPARPTSLMAPPGVRFVMGVSIQGAGRAPGRLKARITPDMLAVFELAARYQMYHAIALALCAFAWTRWPGPAVAAAALLFAAGILLFCGSLYLLSLGAPRWLGAITPFGGTAWIIGWAALAWAALRHG